jgi:hypothetical protein
MAIDYNAVLALVNRIAQLVPPPRTHRHRYYGVLAPNSPLRAALTALSKAEQVVCLVVHAAYLVWPALAQRPSLSRRSNSNLARHHIACGLH